MTQRYVEPIQENMPHVCPKPCIMYRNDAVICNEEPELCVMVVCPGCGKVVSRTPYCLNCMHPLSEARRPYE